MDFIKSRIKNNLYNEVYLKISANKQKTITAYKFSNKGIIFV